MSFDPEDEIEITWIPEGLEEEETELVELDDLTETEKDQIIYDAAHLVRQRMNLIHTTENKIRLYGPVQLSDKKKNFDLDSAVLSTDQINRICKRRYGHTNWARLNTVDLASIRLNPGDISYVEGVFYFHNATEI